MPSLSRWIEVRVSVLGFSKTLSLRLAYLLVCMFLVPVEFLCLICMVVLIIFPTYDSIHERFTVFLGVNL